MAGFTVAEAVATLDARFPTTGGTDKVGWSVNGTSEFAGLAQTAVGATGWAAATSADPSVKANAAVLTTAAATAAGTISHYAVFTGAGVQRTDWEPIKATPGGAATPRALLVGDKLEAAIGTLTVTLT